MDEVPIDPRIRQARTLLRSARSAALATVFDGQPFASLVTPACAPDLSPLLLLSSLAAHTRHLAADPRCSMLVTGQPHSTNPQTTPRLTIAGTAERVEDPALKARWLARHPYAALYADFTDFALWRMKIHSGSLVGGFARAARLAAADLAPDPGVVEALQTVEPGVLAHCNADHAGAMALLGAWGEAADAGFAAGQVSGGDRAGWQLTAIDIDGCDLAAGERVVRLSWLQPLTSAQEIRDALMALVEKARNEVPK